MASAETKKKRRQRLSEDQVRQRGVHAATVAVIALMAAYYVVVYFHSGLLQTISSEFVSGYAALYLIFTAATIALKAGAVTFFARSLKEGGAFRSVATNATLFLSIMIAAGCTLIWAGRVTQRLLASHYWHTMHWVWIFVSLLVLFGVLYRLVINAGFMKWQFVSDLKAVPLVSPVFCLAGPKLWSDNLDRSRFADSLATYNLLSLTAAVLFLAYWVAYAVFNQRYSKNPSGVGHALAVNTCIGLCAAGLYLFFAVLLDILLKLGSS